MQGQVRWYSAKGFGFIDPLSSGGSNGNRAEVEAYYFHISSVVGRTILKQGQIVTFDPTTSVKGLRAVNVRVVETKELKDESNEDKS